MNSNKKKIISKYQLKNTFEKISIKELKKQIFTDNLMIDYIDHEFRLACNACNQIIHDQSIHLEKGEHKYNVCFNCFKNIGYYQWKTLIDLADYIGKLIIDKNLYKIPSLNILTL